MGQNQTKIEVSQGGDTLTVESGGVINVASGGALKFGGVAQSGNVRAGTVTPSASEASAGTLDITTGLSSVTAFFLMVLDSGNNVTTADADVTISGGTVTVADGSSYATTATDTLHWIAVGS